MKSKFNIYELSKFKPKTSGYSHLPIILYFISTFTSFLLAFSTFSFSGYSLGVSPPSLYYNVTYGDPIRATIYVSSSTYLNIQIFIDGNLSPYLSISPSKFNISPNETKEVLITSFEDIPPGRYEGKITILGTSYSYETGNKITKIVEASQISLNINVISNSLIKCTIRNLRIKKYCGNILTISLWTLNEGTTSLRPHLYYEIITKDNELIQRGDLKPFTLIPNEQAQHIFNIHLNSTLSNSDLFLKVDSYDCSNTLITPLIPTQCNLSNIHIIGTEIKEVDNEHFLYVAAKNYEPTSKRIAFSVFFYHKNKTIVNTTDIISLRPGDEITYFFKIPFESGDINTINIDVKLLEIKNNNRSIILDERVLTFSLPQRSSYLHVILKHIKRNMKILISLLLTILLVIILIKVINIKKNFKGGNHVGESKKKRRQYINFNLISVFIIFIIFILPFTPYPSYSYLQQASPTIVSDPYNMSNYDYYAIDSSNQTYSIINLSKEGNITFYDFYTDNYNVNEEIKYVNVSITLEAINISGALWGIFYSDDKGKTWYVLFPYSSNNQTKTSFMFQVQEHNDSRWTWDEVFNNLRLRISILNNSPLTMSGIIYVYHIISISQVDREPPQVTLLSPAQGNITNNTTITFVYNVTDNLSGISNCSLLINGSIVNTTTSPGEGQNNFTYTLTYGHYRWKVICYDNTTISNKGTSETRDIYVDTKGPNITLDSPTNNSIWYTSNNVTFMFTPRDLTNITNCTLYINNTQNKSLANISNNEQNSITTFLVDGSYTWYIVCEDVLGNLGTSQTFNLIVDVNYAPSILALSIDKPISLLVGSYTNVTCNATIQDQDGALDIDHVEAFFYHETSSWSEADNKSIHYTNASCKLISSSENEANYSCGFSLTSYALSGTWYCKVAAYDSYSWEGNLTTNTTVLELYAIEISPQIIDYGIINPGENSTSDEVITIFNRGNTEIDVALSGYALTPGDGLAMVCDQGNISISNERYALSPNIPFSSMQSLTPYDVQLDNFNLQPPEENTNSSKNVYWKLGMPYGVRGNCTGYVKISVTPS